MVVCRRDPAAPDVPRSSNGGQDHGSFVRAERFGHVLDPPLLTAHVTAHRDGHLSRWGDVASGDGAADAALRVILENE
jgi:hypothetical protein